MAAKLRSAQLSLLRVVALAIAGVSLAFAQTTEHQSEEELTSDLRTVIILAGYPCETVLEYSQPGPSDYHVTCDADRHYRVRISEEQRVHVENLSDPGGSVLAADADHRTTMKRHLVAIVNLAGHECAGVVDYELRGRRDSLVTCEDQTVYRIRVTPEGRVAVHKLPIDK